MPPSAFERNSPTPKPTPTFKPKTPKQSKSPGGLSIPNESVYKPVGSGASAWTGGLAGGGGGAMGRK
jgi:hypothetical protein